MCLTKRWSWLKKCTQKPKRHDKPAIHRLRPILSNHGTIGTEPKCFFLFRGARMTQPQPYAMAIHPIILKDEGGVETAIEHVTLRWSLIFSVDREANLVSWETVLCQGHARLPSVSSTSEQHPSTHPRVISSIPKHSQIVPSTSPLKYFKTFAAHFFRRNGVEAFPSNHHRTVRKERAQTSKRRSKNDLVNRCLMAAALFSLPLLHVTIEQICN